MGNKLIRAAVAAVLAFSLWFFVVTVYRTEAEMTFNVPVILDGESELEKRGLMLVGDKDLMVQLKLNGNRSELNKLRGSDIIVIVDLSRIYEPGVKSLEYTISFPGDIRNGAIEVVSRKPSYIALQVAKFDSKEVPLTVEVKGQPASGFIVNDEGIEVVGNSTGTIIIEGPKDTLERVAMAKLYVDVEGATNAGPYDSEVMLCDEQGKPLEVDWSSLTTSNQTYSVKVPLLKEKTVNLVGTVTAGNGLTAEDVELTLKQGTITLVGSSFDLDKVPDSIPVNTFDLSQVTEKMTVQSFDIDLSAYSGVRISSKGENSSGKVEATLTLPDRGEKKIDIVLTQANVKNVPPNRTATFSGSDTVRLEITLEGWIPALDRISPEDIQAEIDVKDGINKDYSVQLTVREEFQSAVQIVSEHQVRITLKIGT